MHRQIGPRGRPDGRERATGCEGARADADVRPGAGADSGANLAAVSSADDGVSRRTMLAAGAAALAAGLPVARADGPTATARPTAAGATGRPAAGASQPAPGGTERIVAVSRGTLSPDGGPAVGAVTLDGSIPGPELRFRQGDILRVLVENRMDDAPTSIHWHGLLVPSGMDGVPGLSNAPIAPRRWYVYEYPLRQAGTYWYHSHVGLQEQQGLYGPLVIEEASDPVGADHDPVILLSDWLHTDPEKVLAGLRRGGSMKDGASMKPTDPPGAGGHGTPMAMPGKDGPDLSDVKYDAFLLNGRGTDSPWTFVAQPGKRIRLRVINGGASTYFGVSLDGHAMTVTHADGMPVEPVEVDRVLMGMGETYDLLVTLKGPGSYTLHAVAQDGSAQAIGVLHTPDVAPQPNRTMPAPSGRTLAYEQLRSPTPTTLPDGPLRTIRLPLRGNMMSYVWTLGDVPFPQAEPLLIRRGDRVRVELVNETAMWHPMHLHGHYYRLLQGAGDRSPLKHTANVPPRGSLAFEFFADNPGSWIFHCHNLYHLEGGMARVFEYEV